MIFSFPKWFVSVSFLILINSAIAEGIEFSDVTDEAGLTHSGDSWGIAWGDFNNDGWPDLYDGNHREKPAFFINQKDGTFVDKVDEIFSHNEIVEFADTHGAQWTDLDNDGFKDLIVQVGGNGGGGTLNWFNTQVLMNENGVLNQRAEELGMAHPNFRGRTPLAFDYDNDGLLDLLLTNMEPIGPRIYNQSSLMVFEDRSEESNLASNEKAVYASITDFDGDDNLELILGQKTSPILNYNAPYFEDVSTAFNINQYGFTEYDTAIGDFDGDIRPDIIETGWEWGRTLLEQPEQGVLAFRYFWPSAPSTKEIGFTFRTTGNVTFKMEGAWLIECNTSGDSDYYFGSSGWHPICESSELRIIEELAPGDPLNQGFYNYDVETDTGIVAVGYDPDLDLWKLIFIYEDRGSEAMPPILYGKIYSENPITIIEKIGAYEDPFRTPSKMYLNTVSGFIEAGTEIGLEQVKSGGNFIVAADFDNDEDLDIYVSATSSVSNVPDVIYENIDGTFISYGVGVDSLEGTGSNLVVADYNLDGYMDVYVTHGQGSFPFNTGPHQLLKNMGQGNNWLEIDLEGVASNRDGIGAKLYLTAGGKTQLREQNGGMHKFGQNHERIHFGLGKNEKVENLEIHWPSGIIQTVTNIPANQTIRIVEKDATLPNVKGNPDVLNGEFGVYIWKDYFDGPYHVRARGEDNNPGEINNTKFTVNVISDTYLLSVNGVGLEANDNLAIKDRSFEFNATTSQWGDGVDFEVTPGSNNLISFESERGSNPRFLFIGENGQHVAPDGWIVDKTSVPDFGDYTPGITHGIVVGKNNGDANTYKLRWSTNEFSHVYSLWVATDEPDMTVDTSLLESGDNLKQSTNAIEIEGKVKAPWEDGLTLYGVTGTKLAVAFELDNLFQQHIVNLFQEVGFPNAYWLETPSPNGQPVDEPGNNLTKIWREEDSNRWHLKFTAGGSGGHKYYQGMITSTGNISIVDRSTLEEQDSLTQTTDNTLEFDTRVIGTWYDEIIVDIEPGANLMFDYSDEDLTNTIRIGGHNWKVMSSPVQLVQ